MAIQFNPPDPPPATVIADQLGEARHHLAELNKRLVRLTKQDRELHDRQWAVALRQGVKAAQSRMSRMPAATTDPGGELVGDMIGLAEIFREQIWPQATCDDLGAELAESRERPGAEIVADLDGLADPGRFIANRLAQLASDLSHDLPDRSPLMDTDPASGPAAADVNAGITNDFLYDVLSTLNGNRASAPPAATSGTGPVAARMRASLDRLGLPQTPGLYGREREARELLVESLRRHFDYRDHDGVRSYHHVERLPAASATATGRGTAGLRGLGLCQAETLRFQADLVLRLLDELPAMTPYVPRLTSFNAEQLRERIRIALEDVVKTMAAPLGPTREQAHGQFRRLLLGVADWLEGGQVVRPRTELRAIAASEEPVRGLSGLRPKLRRHELLSPVASQEIGGRVEALIDALEAIGRVVFDAGDEDAGGRTAQIEQTLTLLGASATALQAELEALGSTPDEQDVTFLGGTGGQASIGQFARWARDVSTAFAGTDDLTASLRRDEFAVLKLELDGLARLAAALDTELSRHSGLRLIGARRQTGEVAALIAVAREQVEDLLADTNDQTDAA